MADETTAVVGESAIEAVELGEDFFREPHAVYERLRRRGPVHFVRFPDASTGWLVTGYEAAKAAFTDPGISKVLGAPDALDAVAASGGDHTIRSGLFKDMMVFYDPPEHTRLRALVNRAFGSRAIRDLEPRVVEIADALLADMATRADETQDLLQEYASPLSMLVICELLGVPPTDRGRFREWSAIVVSSEPTRDARTTAVQEFVGYIDALIRAKMAAPQEDLLSELIAAGEGGNRLSHRELISMVFLLLVAGYETSANLIGNAVALLLSGNGSRASLREDPDRIPAFVEEVLRYESPTRETTFRYTREPVRLGGVEIPAGQVVVLSVAAAGRDPERFTEPDEFDPDRPANQHLAFGHGIHRCVGAQLSRTEGIVALTRLLATHPDLQLAPDADLTWRKSLIVRGLTTVPVRLHP
ncbi:cytochrome P450 family protein [Nocardia macrotermitis]|uniref:Cytochrome P450 107B1 n=1 Tax=Nocardia macrotermitis TaxID=2585198 RepID=A0A7K0DBI7_9NOCA|nr:cytochrome P450 [Nocardia macrotermitis]MQY23153.1 Cytochrome P450 107B1 [Nocardia macrotermitis]